MLINIENATKYFGGTLILNSINTTIENTERIGLVGVNGAGKTTLLKIINEELALDEGSISKTSNLSVGYLKQNSGLESGNTIWEEMLSVFDYLIALENKMRELEKLIANHHDDKNLLAEYAKTQEHFESLDGYLIEVKIKTILNGMGFSDKPFETNVNTLSGGEKTRLALAKLLLEEPNLLILDEPTNHLDFKSLIWLEEYLQTYKGAVLVVSHDRYFLDKVVGTIWEIERNKLTRYKGNYTKYLQLKQEARERHIKEYEAQQLKIASMQDYIARNIVRATTSKSAKSRVHQLENMEIIEKPDGDLKTAKMRFETTKQPHKVVLSVNDLSLSVGEGENKKDLFEHLDFEVRRGEKIAIIGDNGAGKSSFLKAIQGLIPVSHGEIAWSKNVDLSYYDQEISRLDSNKTVLDELWDRHRTMPEYEIRKYLGSVLLTGENVFKEVSVISGGEKAKLMFAILMLEYPNVLIMDEPTNHLDLATKEVLEDALVNFDGTLIFISHDRYFLNKIPTKIVEVSKEQFTEYKGNFDFYLEQQALKAQLVEEIKVEHKEKPKNTNYRSKQQKNEELAKRKRVKELEQLIEDLEHVIEQTELQITLPEIFSDYEKMHALCGKLDSDKQTLSEVYDEWLLLNDE